MRPRKTPEQREEILAAYRQTSLSSQQFARRHGIAASTLFGWLRQSAGPPSSDAAEWIEVPNLIGGRPSTSTYRLSFANGVSVDVPVGFQPDEVLTLAEVVNRL